MRWSSWIVFGFTGVHLFFVLSGYLLFRPFMESMLTARSFPSVSNFWMRRFVRIYPPYLASLLIFTALRFVLKVHVPGLPNFVQHLFLVFNYFEPGDFLSINAVYWSLAVEAQFYVLLPLGTWMFFRLAPKRPNLAVSGSIALFALVGPCARCIEFLATRSIATVDSHAFRIRSVFSFLDLFAFGMCVAYVERSAPSLKLEGTVWQRRGLTALGAIIFIAANRWCAETSPGEWLNVDHLGYTLGISPLLCLGIALVLLAVVTSVGNEFALLRLRPLVWIGEISYSFYLFHIGVMFVFWKIVPISRWSYSVGSVITVIGSIGPSLLLSYLVYRLVEKPSLAYVDRLRKGLRAPTLVEPVAATGRDASR